MSTPSRAVNAHPDPFWTRLPAIIAYPFRGSALITMVMLTLMSILVIFPLIGRIVLLLMMAWAYKYAFEILRRTADGDMDPPEVILAVDNGVVWRFLGAILVMGLVILVAALVTKSTTAEMITAIAMGFLMPACAMTLAMTGSLSEALNPATLFSLIARVGWPYLAVVGMLIVIQATAIQASSILAHALPFFVAILIAVALSFWGLFAAFHLMGYLIFQSHEALGYEPAAFERAAARHEAPGDAVIAQAEPLVREGRMAEAIALLRAEVRSRAVAVEVH